MKNSKTKQRKLPLGTENGLKVRIANIVSNSTWEIGALLAAISAWTAGNFYV